jgi:dTDP-4-dehydrorhamnose reductase
MTSILDRVAIVGASGQLGSDLMHAFRDAAPIALDRRKVDIEQPSSVLQALRTHRPTLLINTAAYHNVDMCEAFAARAFAVNALGVDSLAAACAVAGVPFAHVSTDYVFSGDGERPYGERDEANPINVYGCSKRAGEQLMARHAREQYVFRTSGLFGTAQSAEKGLNFVERMIRGAQAGMSLRVVDDVVFSPSFTRDVADAIRRIVEKGTFGIYHVTNSGFCSWYDLAVEAISAAGLQPHVQRTKSPENAVPRRPRMSALRHDALLEASLSDLPPWQEGVASYVAAREG